jgi:soluble lytic murein transglycosylase-like protein
VRSLWILLLLLATPCLGSPEGLINLTKAVEKDRKIPKKLLVAIIKTESSFNPLAYNPSSRPGVKVSSFGLGQITLQTGRNTCNMSKKDLLQPKKNILCSSTILKNHLERFNGNIKRAISAYNAGTPCECDGRRFVRLDGKGRSCFSENHRFKRCEYGTFLNQPYVNNVLKNFRSVDM